MPEIFQVMVGSCLQVGLGYSWATSSKVKDKLSEINCGYHYLLNSRPLPPYWNSRSQQISTSEFTCI